MILRCTLPLLLLIATCLPVRAAEKAPAQAALATVETPEQEAVRVLKSKDLPIETRRDLLRTLANRNPVSATVWSAYGEALQDAGDSATAVQAFEKASGLNPKLYTPWYRLGILAKRGNPQPDLEKAEGYFRKALDAGSPRPQTLNELGVTVALQGRMKDAVKAWEEALKDDPDWGVLHANIVKAKLQMSDEKGAAETAEASIDAARFDSGAVLKYADHLGQKGRAAEAVPLLRAALEKHADAETRYALAQVLENSGKKDEAVAEYTKVREAVAGTDQAARLSQLVDFSLFRIANPDAERKFQQAREPIFAPAEPGDSKRRETLEKSIATLDKLIAEHPDFWNGYYVRAVALRRIDERDKARTDLKKVLELAPDEPNATLELALLLRDEHEFIESAKLADKAVATAPRDPRFVLNAGLIMIEAGQCDRAWELYRSAVRLVGEQNASVLRDQLDMRCKEGK